MQDKPTLKQLEYFITTAESSSLRSSSERLGISQPTLAAQLSAMEKRLRVVLFERSRSGINLTPAGRELLPGCKLVINEMLGVIDQAQFINEGCGGTFKIGVSPTVGPYLMPHILPGLHREYETLKLYVREKSPIELEAELIEGQLDLVLMPLPLNSNKLSVMPLFSEPLYLLHSSEHAFSQKTHIAACDLQGEDVLTLEQKYTHYQQVQVACEAHGANILRDYEGTSLDALRQMVVMNMGITFLPALYINSEVHQPESLRIAHIPELHLFRTHVLAWRSQAANRVFFKELGRKIIQLVQSNLQQVDLNFSVSPASHH